MPFDKERWNRAYDRWREHLREWVAARDREREENPFANHDSDPEDSFEFPEPVELTFRVCHGCGSEFILNQAQISIHPDERDPWAVCHTCWPELHRGTLDSLGL